MLTVEQVTAWPARPLDGAARQARAAAATLRGQVGEAGDALRRVGGWHGRGRDGAVGRLGQEVDHARELARVLTVFAERAGTASEVLARGRERVLTLAVEGAEQARDAGSQESEEGGAADDRRALQARVREALDELDREDRAHAGELARLVSELEAMVAGHVNVATAEGPRDPDSVVNRLVSMRPAQRRALLSTMSPDDIGRLVTANPQAMGNLEGVPFSVRIEANRRAVAEALDAEIRRGAGEGARADQLRAMLGTIVDPHAPGRRVRRQFVAFANTPEGRAVEMFGSLTQTSRSAAMYVPGTGTKLDTADANRRAAWNFASRSGAPVFLFMDGRFPPDLPSATSPMFAAAMAPQLVSFGRALDAEVAGVAPGAATVYLGHSYGGAVVGTAEQLGLRADRVVYASASGTGILPGGAESWSNPAEVQRYSVTPPADPIQPVQASRLHGGDPDTAPGVTRMDSGDYGDGRRVRGAAGHGGYFDDPDSGGFQNMVKVIRGEAPTGYVCREPDIPLPGTR